MAAGLGKSRYLGLGPDISNNVDRLGKVENKTKLGNLNKNVLSEIMGLLCAEQNVGNLNKCTREPLGRDSAKINTSQSLQATP